MQPCILDYLNQGLIVIQVRRSSKIKDSGSDKGKGSLSERVRQAICAGFFCNVARKFVKRIIKPLQLWS
jgi:hypothetical protein